MKRGKNEEKQSANSALEVSKIALDIAFDRAVKEGRFLSPEGAINEGRDLIRGLLDNRSEVPDQPKSSVRRPTKVPSLAFQREFIKGQYKHAVTAYLRAYFGARRPGRPRLSDSETERLLDLKSKNYSYGRMAKESGFDTTDPVSFLQAKDRFRKRLKTAEKHDKQKQS